MDSRKKKNILAFSIIPGTKTQQQKYGRKRTRTKFRKQALVMGDDRREGCCGGREAYGDEGKAGR